MKLLFATGNRGKLREAREILAPMVEVLGTADLGITAEAEETALTLKENSVIKARFIHGLTGLDCFADDTGLEVDALGGAPGVHAARFAQDIARRDGLPLPPDHDFGANIDALLRELEKHPGEPRTARFRSVVTLLLGGECHFFEGTLEGRIAYSRSGSGGFGYDPVFIADEYPDLSVSELPEDVKNSISHRGKALRAMAEWLKNCYYPGV
ncbi:MAG: RdgB/HAM1 family non-canonical purine NTP pyrophosphatase [Bacteroidales bacterium]|nr:RdgB/HAM1 family non-canonical purine NTP pyrophosphatase [Bacteroidales bacterium]